MDTSSGLCRMVLNERQIDQERAIHYALDFDLSRQETTALLAQGEQKVTYEGLSVAVLEQARPHLVSALTCTLTHPSGKTFAAWLREIGFQKVEPSYSGGRFAWRLFNQLAEERRPQDLASLDAYLRPCVEAFVQFAAPLYVDPPITATKQVNVFRIAKGRDRGVPGAVGCPGAVAAARRDPADGRVVASHPLAGEPVLPRNGLGCALGEERERDPPRSKHDGRS